MGIAGTDGKLIEVKKYIFYEKSKKLIWALKLAIQFNLTQKLLKNLLSSGIVPIIAPVGANKKGVKYNINADITAGFISHKMRARRFDDN